MPVQAYTIQTLPLGSVIERRGRRYYKCQGADGVIVMAENDHGMWWFIDRDGHSNWTTASKWKTFKVLFVP